MPYFSITPTYERARATPAPILVSEPAHCGRLYMPKGITVLCERVDPRERHDSPQPVEAPHSVLLAGLGGHDCEFVYDLLRTNNFRVAFGKGGRAALALLADNQFDLLVTCVLMPDMDGLELLRAARERRPELPIFVLTRGREKIDRVYLRFAKLFGANETYAGPIAPEAFIEGVDHALHGAPSLGV